MEPGAYHEQMDNKDEQSIDVPHSISQNSDRKNGEPQIRTAPMPSSSAYNTRQSGSSAQVRMPMLKINVPYAFSSNQVQELFQQASSAQNFEVIEMEQTIATAVNKEPLSLSKLFIQCLPATFTGVFASRSSHGRNDEPSSNGRHEFVEEDMGYEV